MKKQHLSSYLCFLSILLYISCKGKEQTSARNQHSIIADTVVKDIPPDKNTPAFRALKNAIEAKIQLSSLENGSPEMQIRIWIGLKTGEDQLLVLRKKDKLWYGDLYSLQFNYGSKNDSLISIAKNIQRIAPLSGWDSLMRRLFDMRILTLPDLSAIQKYHTSADANGVTVEIGSPGQYRIYSYPEVDRFAEKVPEAKLMVNILDLLFKEFVLEHRRF